MWAILALALLVPRANRTREALLILVPILAANLVWLVGAMISRPVTSDRETIGMMVQSLAVGSAVLWLLGPTLAKRRRGMRLVLALGAMLGVAGVGALSVTDLSRHNIMVPVLLGLLMLVMVLGYAGAGWMSRGTYRSTRFFLLLAAWTVAFCAAAMPLWFLLGSAMTNNWPGHLLHVLGVFLLAGAISGACVSLLSLSFVLVGLRSPLFRPRLFGCLGLPPGPAPGDNTAVADMRKGG